LPPGATQDPKDVHRLQARVAEGIAALKLRPDAATGDVGETTDAAGPTPVAADGRGYLHQRIAETRRWLPAADSRHYSIQLMLISRSAGHRLASDLRHAGLKEALDRIYVYESSFRGQDVLGVLLDEYPSYTEASNALAALPEWFAVNGPFIRNISDLQVQ
jgi:septal ring-binding cell division protein DamX